MATRPAIDRLLAGAARVHSRRVLGRFLRAAEQATRTQQDVLFQKIRRNADSAYGRDHGFGSIRTYEDFACQVPVSRYEDLAPYVNRVMAGETTAMFAGRQRVLMFAMTSGTTDQPKHIPVTERFLADYRRGWNAFGIKALMDHPDGFLRPIVQVTSPMDEQRAPSGVPCGAITGLMASTQKRIVRRYYVTPPCVAYIPDAQARYYTIMRLAMTGEVGFMITANPATQLRLARIGDTNAEHIIRDIHDGSLSSDVDVPQQVRDELAPRLKPDPARGEELRRIHQVTGRLLPKDVWNLGFVANWTAGTLGLYLQDFPEFFGDTPVRDIGLLASEGRVSIPIADATPAGILEVTGNFFEFIPARERESDTPTVLRSHEVEVGGEYFVLLTTSAGFYRYDLGDQIRVVGFHGQAPVIEFLHKGLHVSSLTGEKLTEQQAVLAFDRACRAMGVAGNIFVIAPQWAQTPFYRLHVARSLIGSPDRADRMAAELDRQLRSANIEYACKQDTGRLGPLRVNLLPDGFFADMETTISRRRRGRQEQYKHRYLFPKPGDDADFPVPRPDPAPQTMR